MVQWRQKCKWRSRKCSGCPQCKRGGGSKTSPEETGRQNDRYALGLAALELMYGESELAEQWEGHECCKSKCYTDAKKKKKKKQSWREKRECDEDEEDEEIEKSNLALKQFVKDEMEEYETWSRRKCALAVISALLELTVPESLKNASLDELTEGWQLARAARDDLEAALSRLGCK